MGRTIAEKKEIVADLKQLLDESNLALIVDYQGLTVAEITDLRTRLRPSGAICKRTKNTLMRIAISEDPRWQSMDEFLKDSSVFLLVKEDMRGAIEAYEDFKKATKKTEIRGGVLDGQVLSANDVTALKDLPTKEELMARLAGGLNAVSTKLAVGLNAVPTKLGVGINEVPKKLVRAVKAVSEKEDSQDQAAA